MINCKCMMATMKFLLCVFILGLVVGGVNAAGCQSGWRKYQNKCYRFEGSNKLKWVPAENKCKSYGGHLVSIHSQGEQDFIYNTIDNDGHWWLGFNDRAREGSYVWSDGSAVNFVNWNVHEPNNLRGEDCAHMLKYYYKDEWNDRSCDDSRHVFKYICKKNVDYCAPNPCLNGGVCSSKDNGYTCTCAAGYSGKTCETDIDECAPAPCQNGGECTDRVNGYTCSCAAGYTGTNCEIDINECESEPCQNGGACNDGVNGYTCGCRDGYVGVHCETAVCPSGWSEKFNNCYLFEWTAKQKWLPAENRCKSLGGHLVSIHSQAEQDYIYNTINNDGHWWLGFNDRAREGRYVWSDGSAVDFVNWNVHEPNNLRGEDCAHMLKYYYKDEWNDRSCDDNRHVFNYICKRPKRS